MQIGTVNPVLPVSATVTVRPGPMSAGASESAVAADESRRPDSVAGEADASRGPLELTEAEEALVRELQQRDREVRAHELAHVVAGGRYVTRPASYDYQTGPDGRRYAVGGEVSIDTSVPADPEEALAKAETIERAALAPVDPSPQDYQVAARARQMAAEARRELAAERLGSDGSESDEQMAETDVARRGDSPQPDNVQLVTQDSLLPTSSFSVFA